MRLQVYDFAKDKPALVSWLSNAPQSKFALGGSKHSQLIEKLEGDKKKRARGRIKLHWKISLLKTDMMCITSCFRQFVGERGM